MANIFNKEDTKIFKSAIQSFVTKLGLDTDGLSFTAEKQEDGKIHLNLYFEPAHPKAEMAHIGSAMIGAMVGKMTAEQLQRREEAQEAFCPKRPIVHTDGKLDMTFASKDELIDCVNALTNSKQLKLEHKEYIAVKHSLR